MSDFTYDLAIVGAGPGGYVAAIRASQLGLKTVLIEKDKVGGVCLRSGCIPSKALLHQAELMRSLPALAALGVTCDTTNFDYGKAWQKSRDIAAKLSRGVAGLIKKNNIEFIQGSATLSGPHELKVVESGNPAGRAISAKNILLATGSRPKSLPGFDFDGDAIMSSTDILMMDGLPQSLIILGAGAIGVEFACIMASFGVKVTLVEMAQRNFTGLEADAVKVLHTELKKMNITIHTGQAAKELEYTAEGISLVCGSADGSDQTIEAEKILVAVGRTPNSEKTGLEELGINLEKGCVKVGDYYQTQVPSVYAIGDLLNTPQLAHLASKEGEIAVAHMAGKETPKQADPDAVPAAVYTSPELACFGPNAAEIQKRGLTVKSYSFPFMGIGRAIASEQATGFVKIIQDASSHKILGATIVGPGATELIHELLLARDAGLTPDAIAGLVHAHPTLSEGIMEAARGLEGWAIHI